MSYSRWTHESGWYIYEIAGGETREEYVLAFSHTSTVDTFTLTYKEVASILHTQNYAVFWQHVDDSPMYIDHLAKCMKSWFEDIENATKEYYHANADSRRHGGDLDLSKANQPKGLVCDTGNPVIPRMVPWVSEAIQSRYPLLLRYQQQGPDAFGNQSED